MRILLDESLPRGLARYFPEHEVTTVPQRGWASLRDDTLLALASTEFDVFVTADQHLEYQQDLGRFSIAVVVLASPSNRLHDLVRSVARLRQLLPFLAPGRAVWIETPLRE